MASEVPPIPDSLVENLAFNLGEAGARAWLDTAQEQACTLFEAWELRPDVVLTGGAFSLCVKCDGAGDGAGDGEPLVLKIPTSVESGLGEIEALRAWAGDGAARVLRTDPATAAMLMNFLGWVGAGDYTLEDVADLAGRLHAARPQGSHFRTIEDNLAIRVRWAGERFAEPGYERHQADLAHAEKLLVDLVAADHYPVLLHGDLQAKNLIVSARGLTAVDPMPVLGPGVFDLAFWIAKSSPAFLPARPMHAYVDLVAGLLPGVDPEALLAWTWALAVLENRPYIAGGAAVRQQFIDEFRDRAVH